MDWIGQHWLELTSLLLIAAGVLWLMPGSKHRPKPVGIVLTLGGLALLAWQIDDFTSPIGESILFWLFAGVAVLSAVLMITNRKPVYSALWFASVTLSTCGLFLLQYAPFLAAATVVVYAGAIVVTFVFVIMLAQQSGAPPYDQWARQPFVATVAAFVVLAIIVGALRDFSIAEQAMNSADSSAINASDVVQSGKTVRAAPESREGVANPLSQVPPKQPLGKIHALGRSLFGDYLYAVELAGTLLLVATIGAIAIAPRRRRGTL